MKDIMGLLGVVGALGNTFIAIIAWMIYGHPWWAAFWLVLGVISIWICLERLLVQTSKKNDGTSA